MSQFDWMKDPALANISEEKKAFLALLFNEAKGKTQKEMMPFFLNLSMRMKKEGYSFTPNEIQAIIRVIKNNSTDEEKKKIDMILEKGTKKPKA